MGLLRRMGALPGFAVRRAGRAARALAEELEALLRRLLDNHRGRGSLPTQLLALCLLFTLLLAAGHVTIRQSSAQMLERDASRIASDWTRYLDRRRAAIERILAAGGGARELEQIVEGGPAAESVVAFALQSERGRLVYASRMPAAARPRSAQAASSNYQEGPVVALQPQEEPGSGQTLADIDLPLAGESGSRLHITIDQSAMQSMFLAVVGETGLRLGLILAVAFGVPFLGYLIQSRRKHQAEKRLLFLAQHDTLTQLANRATFKRTLAALLASSGSSQRLAVHHLDLDEFKAVNETFGQGSGDELLRQVAVRLSETLRESDCIARLGGDEFVILQSGIRDREQACALAGRIVQVLSGRYELRGQSVRVSASVGVAVAPQDAEDCDRLMSCAELALFFAKSAGRSCYRAFEASMYDALKRRLRLEARLRTAVESRLFEVHYQPFYASRERKLLGFEALVRLRDETGAMISPAEFVPVAEDMGLIDDIGAFVIEEACRNAAAWPAHLRIAVNLSPVQFRSGRLAETIARAIEQTGVAPDQLELEVTEGLLLGNTDTVRVQLDAMKRLGASIVLDDFGTGYSSLSYLWQFAFDKIKIDQSFVRAMSVGGSVTDIVAAIVTLGRTLKAKIQAEGVETEEQAEQLRTMRCDQVQGYLFSRPLPLEKANELALAAGLERHRARRMLAG